MLMWGISYEQLAGTTVLMWGISYEQLAGTTVFAATRKLLVHAPITEKGCVS